MDDFRISIDMAAGLDAPVLTIVVGGVEPNTLGVSESLKLVADRVADAAPYAAERGVSLALEPLHPVYGGDRSCLVTARDAVGLCSAIGHDNVGLAIDVYHVWWDTSLAAELRRAGQARILGYHLCDWLASTRDVLLDRGSAMPDPARWRYSRPATGGSATLGRCSTAASSVFARFADKLSSRLGFLRP
ncbi:sugar phosphate isomerase/epimerase [Mesorhizobium sp.]|uniref:sugar phosphate isomerase/epimerase family protein n=1 Tax=Mesorhizobium sp. TaxID=1871066 RepID=UPI0025BC85D4|nr:sugar phosphate isomerase/epimerase family protein [Mesorhizobium sp.]